MDTQTSVAGNTRSNGDYITVDGVRTYYESTGTGEPLLLLHGGLMTAESWDPQVPALAQRYRVYVLEQFGHGRTPDIDGPLTYEAMAQHTTAFLDALGISSAHLCGWSDGALVALLAALRRPSLVRKIVHIDCFITLGDAPAGYLDFIRAMTRFRIDEVLFGIADARRHLIATDPQAQAALATFGEAQKLTELSKGARKIAKK